MVVKTATAGMLGVDVNEVVTYAQAEELKANGYEFCIRYLPRSAALAKGNLTLFEINTILSAGLGVGAVQHCPLPGWMPSTELGMEYGQYAAEYADKIELPTGMNIWLDLETPGVSAKAQDIINYATAWFNK